MSFWHVPISLAAASEPKCIDPLPARLPSCILRSSYPDSEGLEGTLLSPSRPSNKEVIMQETYLRQQISCDTITPPDSHTPICLEWTIPPRSHGLCDLSHRQSDISRSRPTCSDNRGLHTTCFHGLPCMKFSTLVSCSSGHLPSSCILSRLSMLATR